MKTIRFFLIVSLSCVVSGVFSYKPVFLLHGVLTGQPSMEQIETRIKTVRVSKTFYNNFLF